MRDVTDAEVEAAAEALWQRDPHKFARNGIWGDELFQDRYRDDARAALEAARKVKEGRDGQNR